MSSMQYISKNRTCLVASTFYEPSRNKESPSLPRSHFQGSRIPLKVRNPREAKWKTTRVDKICFSRPRVRGFSISTCADLYFQRTWFHAKKIMLGYFIGCFICLCSFITNPDAKSKLLVLSLKPDSDTRFKLVQHSEHCYSSRNIR